MKKLISLLLLLVPAISSAAVHVGQGDKARFASVTTASATITGAGIVFQDLTLMASTSTFASSSTVKDWTNTVSVKDYGAKGDGTTDDYASFAAAIATGKNVYIPATTNGYKLTQTPNVTTNYQKIFGAGWGSRIFQTGTNANSTVFNVSSATGVVISDMWVLPSSTTNNQVYGYGVFAQNCSNLRVTGLMISGHAQGGIGFYMTNDSQMTNNWAVNSATKTGVDFFILYGGNRNLISGNHSINGGTGIGIQTILGGGTANDNIISDNHITSATVYGIILYRANDPPETYALYRNQVVNNTVDYVSGNYDFPGSGFVGGTGIYNQAAEHTLISGNQIYNTSSFTTVDQLAPGGIGSTNSGGVTISNNIVRKTGSWPCVTVRDPSYIGIQGGVANVMGNDLAECRDGVEINQRGYVTVKDNTISTTTVRGVLVNQYSTYQRDINIDNNKFWNIGQTVISAQNTNGLSITNNKAQQWGAGGYYLTSVTGSSNVVVDLNQGVNPKSGAYGLSFPLGNIGLAVRSNYIQGAEYAMVLNSPVMQFGNKLVGSVSGDCIGTYCTDYYALYGTGGTGGGMTPGASYYVMIDSTSQQPGGFWVQSGTVTTLGIGASGSINQESGKFVMRDTAKIHIGENSINPALPNVNYQTCIGKDACSGANSSLLAIGLGAGSGVTGGDGIFIGNGAGGPAANNSSATDLIAIGNGGIFGAMTPGAAGKAVAIGTESQAKLTTGFQNTSVGWNSLKNVTTGLENTSIGHRAGENIWSGQHNTAVGMCANGCNNPDTDFANGGASDSVFVGFAAGGCENPPCDFAFINGDKSQFIGANTGRTSTGTTPSPSNITALGYGVRVPKNDTAMIGQYGNAGDNFTQDVMVSSLTTHYGVRFGDGSFLTSASALITSSMTLTDLTVTSSTTLANVTASSMSITQLIVTTTATLQNVIVPTLTNNSCVGTNASGLFITGTCGSGGGGASVLETMVNGVRISSPTPTIAFTNAFLGSIAGSATTQIGINPSSVAVLTNGLIPNNLIDSGSVTKQGVVSLQSLGGYVTSAVLPSSVSYTTRNETITGIKTFTASSTTFLSTGQLVANMKSTVANGANTGGAHVVLTQDSGTALGNGDRLGGFIYQGLTTTPGTVVNGAAINAYALGTYTTASYPTRMVFEVAAPAETTRRQVLNITSTGVGLSTGVPQDMLDVYGDARVSGRVLISSNTVMPGTTNYQDGTLAVTRIIWPNGTIQVSSPSLVTGGGGGGYNVEPATVTFNLAQGATIQTLVVNATTTFNGPVQFNNGTNDWPQFIPASNGKTYNMTGSTAAVIAGQIPVFVSTNGAFVTTPMPTGGSGLASIAASGQSAITSSATLEGSTNVTLTQVGNTIRIASTGGSGSGVTVYPATATALFPYGARMSTFTVVNTNGLFFSSNTVLEASKSWGVYLSSNVYINGVRMAFPSSGTIGGYLRYVSSNTLQWDAATATGGGGSGSSTLGVDVGGVRISSPTSTLILSSAFTGSLGGASTAQIGINPSSVAVLSGGFVPNNLLDSGSVTKQGYITLAGLGGIAGNQTITLSGDATGSGATAITVSHSANQPNIVTLSASSVTVAGASGLVVPGPVRMGAAGSVVRISSNTIIGGATSYADGRIVSSNLFTGTLAATTVNATTLNGQVGQASQGSIVSFTASSITVYGPFWAKGTSQHTGTSQFDGRVTIATSTILTGATFYQNGPILLGVPGTYVAVASNTYLNGRVWAQSLTPGTSTFAAIASSGTITPNAGLANTFVIPLLSNITINGPSNPIDGQKALFRLAQDGAARTVTWATGAGNFGFGADIASVTLSSGGSKTDYVGAVYNATANRWHIISAVLGY